MSPRAATAVPVVVLSVALLLRLACLLAVPFGPLSAHRLGGLNDEPAHFAYARYLAEHRSFPVQTRHVAEPGAFERADFEYYQPPLYYLLCAPLIAIAGGKAAIPWCRGVSLLAGMLSLVLLARILTRLGLDPAARWAGVACVAVLPVHVYFSSLVSNDAACWLFALWITDTLLARAQGEPSASIDLRLGLLLGLGMLTKTGIAVFYPVALLVYVLVARRGPRERRARGIAIAFSVSALIAGAWYVRNWMVYGSPLALEVGFGPPEPGRLGLPAQIGAAIRTIDTLWLPFPHPRETAAIQALRVVGGLIVLVHSAVALGWLARRLPLDPARATIVAILAVTLASHLALSLRWGEAEGRFLLPALAPIVYLTVLPVWGIAAQLGGGVRAAWIYLIVLALHPYLFLALG